MNCGDRKFQSIIECFVCLNEPFRCLNCCHQPFDCFAINLNVEAKVEDSSHCRGGVILHINIRSRKRINFTFKISECEEIFQIVPPSSVREHGTSLLVQ